MTERPGRKLFQRHPPKSSKQRISHTSIHRNKVEKLLQAFREHVPSLCHSICSLEMSGVFVVFPSRLSTTTSVVIFPFHLPREQESRCIRLRRTGNVESNNLGREIDKERYLGWLVLVDEQCQSSRASALVENGISRKSTISEES